MPPDAEEIRQRAPEGWALVDDTLRKEFAFKGFTTAVAFVQRLVAPANEARHHPDLEIHYNRVVVSLTTHDAGGVTDEDLALAGVIETLVEP
jgi:4a-hydroxytetrahydrobiopterin dehydratase